MRHALAQATLVIAAFLAVEPGLGQQSPKLEMTITRSNKLPPINKLLAPGELFDEGLVIAKIKGHDVSNYWYQVPTFCAGHWRSRESKGTYHSNDKNGDVDINFKVGQLRNIGDYIDSTDHVWQYEDPDSWRHYCPLIDKEIRHFCEISRKQHTATDNEFTYSTEFIVVRTAKDSNQIIRSERGTTEVAITRLDSNAFLSKVFERTFKLDGKPIQRTFTETRYERIGHLIPDPSRKTANGKPLYRLFIQFLSEHDMADRIPKFPLMEDETNINH